MLSSHPKVCLCYEMQLASPPKIDHHVCVFLLSFYSHPPFYLYVIVLIDLMVLPYGSSLKLLCYYLTYVISLIGSKLLCYLLFFLISKNEDNSK